MTNNIITFPTNDIVIEDAVVRPLISDNRINPVISETVTQVNSILPTSSWEANNWDERTLPWEGIESGRDLSRLEGARTLQRAGVRHRLHDILVPDGTARAVPEAPLRGRARHAP